MKINILKKIGLDNYTFQVDKEKELDALAEAGFLASMPDRCSICKGDVVLSSHKSTSEKGIFTFVYMLCRQCGAKAQVGQYKAGGFYWKRFEQYQGGQKNEEVDTNAPF